MSLDAHDVAVITDPTRTVNNPLEHPTDAGLGTTLRENAWRLLEGDDPENTKKAFEPKMTEYFAFCELVSPNDPHCTVLDHDKMYQFMYYQTFREQKKRGGRRISHANKPVFDVHAFRDVMSCYTDPTAGLTTASTPKPTNPVSKSVFDQYKATFRKIYNIQKVRGVLSAQWDDLWKKPLNDLEKHVKLRAPKIKKASYGEKVSNDFSPYLYVDRYKDIEAALWNDSTNIPGARSVAAGLRHRYVLLQNTSGILRCESLYKADLSDLLGVVVPSDDRDAHRMFIMVNQVPFGKTNHGRTLYGRATRHRDVKQCAIAAFSFYLQYRLFVTDEFKDFTVDDWCDSSKWFDVKLLVDVTSTDKTKMMKNDSYARKLKGILTRLHLPTDILVHFGRKIGPKVLNCFEEESQDIERLGNWNPSLMDSTYSSKLPIKPIRCMAGYSSKTNLYYLSRGTIDPPQELLESTPLGKWVYTALAGVQKKVLESNNSKHQTAYHVLYFFRDINRFFLQDAAAMTIEDESRREHAIFKELPVFKTQMWEEYVDKMKRHLSSDSDPVAAKLENVIPGLHPWHRANDASMRKLSQAVEELKQRLDQDRRSIVDAIVDSLQEKIAEGLSRAADRLPPLRNIQDGNLFNGLEQESRQNESTAGRTNEATTNDHHQFAMKAKYNTLRSLYQEWYGLGEYQDSHGGVAGRNKTYGSKWRQHINRQHYSRVKRIVEAIDVERERTGNDWTVVVEALEPMFMAAKKSIANMVTKLQQEGRVPRHKKRKASEVSAS